MKFIFSRVPKHRRFKVEPIYFDSNKEERKDRERRLREEMGLTPEVEEDRGSTESRVRGKMRRRFKGGSDMVRIEKRKSNLRLILILIGLMILFYYFIISGRLWYSHVI